MKQEGTAPDSVGVVYFLSKKNSGRGGFRRTGYRILPHTRRGYYRKHKNGKTIYVKTATIHKEKYERIQSAHRMNQPGGKSKLGQEEEGNAFSQGMSW